MSNSVFVYGTLKSGNSRDLSEYGIHHAKLVGEATSDPLYNMWNLVNFPAVTIDGENKVAGEVWDVSERMMKELDYIEGYPDFYQRKIVNTTQGEAWMYYLPLTLIDGDDKQIEPVNNLLVWNQ